MRKLFTLLTIGIGFFALVGCEDVNNPKPIDPDPIVTPEPPVSELNKYLDELKDITNVEMYQIFERYGDFTDELENYVYLGSYPGREVTNVDLVTELDKITATNTNGYLEYQDFEFSKVTIVNTYDSLEIGDESYENFTKYKIGTTHYFLVEPILWRVLSQNATSKQAFLMTNNILDAQIFQSKTEDYVIDNKTFYPSNYEHSDVRNWCNNTFYNIAFTSTEKEKITLAKINNRAVTYPSTLVSYDNDTEDYIYLPSFREMTNKLYGFEESGIFSYSRFSTPSDFASAKGVYTSSLENPVSGLYLLRSGYEYIRSYIPFVKFDGYSLNPYYTNSPSTGVRLCCKAIVEPKK